MEPYSKVFKGKSASTSVPIISMRYNAEDDELEQLIEAQPETGPAENVSVSCSESPLMEKKKDIPGITSKLSKRTGSLEDASSASTVETWKFLSDIKGRITKTVEEKLEEIKSDRLKKKGEKKKKLVTGGENSSISDSEERSESSRQSPLKESIKESEGESSDVSTSSLGRKQSVEMTEIDISDTTPVKEESSLKKSFLGNFRKYDKSRPPRQKRKKRDNNVEMAEEAVEEGAEHNGPQRNKRHSIVPDHHYLLSAAISWWPACFVAFLAILARFSLIHTELVWLSLGMSLAWLCSAVWGTGVRWYSGTDGVPVLFTRDFHLETVPIVGDKLDSALDQSSNPQHEGWMNEYEGEYNPETYKVSMTTPVLVSLYGCRLRIAVPTVAAAVPKRASWNEPDHSSVPIALLRHYSLTNCTISLRPQGLARKRLWSKKYPIYIELLCDSYLGSVHKDRDAGQDIVSAGIPTETGICAASAAEAGNGTDLISSVSIIEKEIDTEEKEDALETELMQVDEDNSQKTIDQVETPSRDDDLDLDFVHVSDSLVSNRSYICLFARSDREKEIWFRKLVAATTYSSCGEEEAIEGIGVRDTETGTSQIEARCQRNALNLQYVDYIKGLGQVLPKPITRKSKWKGKDAQGGGMWFNVFVSRVLFDMLNDPSMVGKIQDKIQRKLSTVRLPSIIEELVVSRLEIAGPGPVVESWSEVTVDQDGVWADLDISYKGHFSMIVDIKLNLVKKKPPAAGTSVGDVELTDLTSTEKGAISPSSTGNAMVKSAAFHSSMEDSGESSSDDLDRSRVIDTPSPHSPQKHRNVVERIAASKYFLQVADNKYVKKALENVSNAHIALIVEVKGLVGTLVVNMPPPPSDRLWYGFRPKPKLWLTARPALGERVLNIVNITRWIEKRLYKEFEKILVMPNMDDLVIPVMDRRNPF